MDNNENNQELASKILSQALGLPVFVYSWVMSENTELNPDWHEKDEQISLQLVKYCLDLATRTYIGGFRIVITDRSASEGEPHYAIDIQLGASNIDDQPLTPIYIEYLAKEEGNKHLGYIEAMVNFSGTVEEHKAFANFLFAEYWRLLDKYYPNFYTSYFIKTNDQEYSPIEAYPDHKK